MKTVTLITALLGASSLLQAQEAPRKIQLLIITGQDKHPWREATPFIRSILDQTGRFEVRVTEEFHGATTETLAPYDAAVLIYSDEKLAVAPWGPVTRDALLQFVKSGKGLVVYHHSAASFQDWPEYQKLCGCVWRSNDSHHAPVHDYEVTIRDHDHSVTRGMKSFFAKTDELYAGLKCIPLENLRVLATGYDDRSLYPERAFAKLPPGPSKDEPLIWTHSYGAGRVFATMLGNDMRAVHTAGFTSTFVRGAEWVATGEVTIPLPAELQ